MSVEVKLCGLTRLADARAALEAGADYLGFVFYPASARAVTVEQVAGFKEALPETARLVGVFVNSAPAPVREAAQRCGLAAVQIHGDEAPDGFVDFPMPVWRALAVDARGARPDPAAWPAARYVVDAAVPGVYGGTGVAADWAMASELARAYPVMLAGGLRPNTVCAAIARVRPMGVDVSSGVEAAPGRKDHAAMRAFVAAAKGGAYDERA